MVNELTIPGGIAATVVAEAAGGTDVLRNPAEPDGNRHTAFIDADSSDLTVLDGPFANAPASAPNAVIRRT